MPDDFIPIAWYEKPVLSASDGNNYKAIEKIYTNERTFKAQPDEIRQMQKHNFAEQISIFDFMDDSNE